MKEIKGNLITMALNGDFDVICHGVNCFCLQGAGIAVQMSKTFGTHDPELFGLEDDKFKGDINKLGHIDYKGFFVNRNGITSDGDHTGELIVVNAYTQYNYGRNHVDGIAHPLDYEALTLCLRKINHIFKGKHIGLPKIGCGLAGGIWDINDLEDPDEYLKYPTDFIFVKDIIKRELKDCKVTIVIYK